ncbi:unnamed protein product [Vitrella brassicaformis CCMP3155]|uniref:Uncharacterized protein n=1 Tax=Vitrella brassicaformis (strain CCMP3155) TaxID=1169540 RepID=A0A0G4EL59_VITBC|nr:unnamed protein product [Vitrella brassicaformis CCMP3155]|eukprot:CEL98146.1 unnamed protein product [Vitrella brassicaformis CCMP3155]
MVIFFYDKEQKIVDGKEKCLVSEVFGEQGLEPDNPILMQAVRKRHAGEPPIKKSGTMSLSLIHTVGGLNHKSRRDVISPEELTGPFEDNAIPPYTGGPADEMYVRLHVQRELLQRVVEVANKARKQQQRWDVKLTKGMAVKSAYSVELANGEIMTLEGSPGDLCLIPRVSASRPATTCTGKVAVIVDAMAKDASFTDSQLDQLSGEMMVSGVGCVV